MTQLQRLVIMITVVESLFVVVVVGKKQKLCMCRMSILVKQDRAADNGSFLLINNTLHLRLESLMILYCIKAHFCAILDKKRHLDTNLPD